MSRRASEQVTAARRQIRRAEQFNGLEELAAVLCEPTRLRIVEALMTSEFSVSELAEPFAMSLPAVSKHLKVLERAGLIERGREAQWRPCKLKPEPLKQAAGWIEQYRAFWEARFDRLERRGIRVRSPSPSARSSDQPRARRLLGRPCRRVSTSWRR